MQGNARSPSRRHSALRAARLIPLLLVASLALVGGSSAVLGKQPAQQGKTKIEITITGTVSPAQRAQIDDLLKAFDQQNPHLKIKAEKREGGEGEKEKESKADKYLFFPLTAAMLGTVVASTVLAQGWRKSKYGINLLGNVATAAAFALVAASGVLLIFDVESEQLGLDIKFWHVVLGIVFVYLIVFHLMNNWRAWLSYGRRLVRSARNLRGQRGN